MFDLAFIWAGLIAFAVLAYVVLDGFDLGVGILFPLFPERHDRDLMTNSIAPVWDGNETWLVLGGGGLLAVFPVVYATVLPALYMPIILMLLGLLDGTFDGDALFFHRTVSVSGQTEAIVALRNAIEDAELTPADLLNLNGEAARLADRGILGSLNLARRILTGAATQPRQ